LFKLGAEKLGARRIVEGERGERFEDAEAAGIATVFGFDADDGDDDFFRHPVEGTGARQLGLVFLPEADAAINAPVVQETRPVTFPGALLRRAGRLDQLQDLAVRADLGELGEQLVGVEALALFEFAREVDDGCLVGKARGVVRSGSQSGQAGEQQGAKGVLQVVLHQGRRATAARSVFRLSLAPA